MLLSFISHLFLFFSAFCPPQLIFRQENTAYNTLLQKANTHTHTSTHSSLLRNMRAGSNSQAGKAVVDSNLDLAGLGYFYFPKSHGGRGVEGGEFMCWGGGLKSFYKCQTMTSDQLHPHKQSRKETHRSPSQQPAQDGVSGGEDG